MKRGFMKMTIVGCCPQIYLISWLNYNLCHWRSRLLMQDTKLPRATEKMTPGLDRTASWSNPAPTDTGPFDFYLNKGKHQCLEKTTIHYWWRMELPCAKACSWAVSVYPWDNELPSGSRGRVCACNVYSPSAWGDLAPKAELPFKASPTTRCTKEARAGSC